MATAAMSHLAKASVSGGISGLIQRATTMLPENNSGASRKSPGTANSDILFMFFPSYHLRASIWTVGALFRRVDKSVPEGNLTYGLPRGPEESQPVDELAAFFSIKRVVANYFLRFSLFIR